MEEVIDVVGGGEVRAGSGAKSESFTFLDAVGGANLIVAPNPETVLDTSGVPSCR